MLGKAKTQKEKEKNKEKKTDNLDKQQKGK